jgi:membrane-associated protease RseP (regulator of RpoE activity)
LAGGVDPLLPVALEGRQSVAARSGRVDGNVGMPILSRFHLIVDFPDGRVLFAPPVDVDTAFDVNHTGLTLQPGDHGVKVLYVAPNSPAAAAGLKVNDVIVSVDGVSTSARPTDGRRKNAWLNDAPGKILSLRLSDGESKTLILGRYF